MKALILVDLQNDFLPGGALAVPQGDEVLPVANLSNAPSTSSWPRRTGTQQTTGASPPAIPGRKPGEMAELGGLPQVLWPTHCVQDSVGAAFAPALDTTRLTRVFPKGTDPAIDSYSGFFDNGQRKATGLGDFLRNRGVTDVYLLGLATDYCVKATALDARRLGFTVHLILDGCRAVDLCIGDGERAVEEMRLACVHLTTSEDVLRAADATPTPGTKKYRKKQVVVDATLWNRPGDHPAVTHPVPVNVPIIEQGREIAPTALERATLPTGAIKTLEGWMLVRPGDFIIRGVAGEHYACKPDIFVRTYEPVV